MQILLFIGIGLWLWFVTPAKDVANLFWKDSAAPWEKVDSFYYPSRRNMIEFQMEAGLASVDECRSWVRSIAARQGDPGILRGDYECGVQQLSSFAGLRVYRLTVR